MSEFRFISQTIYALKRQFPASIVLRRVASSRLDVTTGQTYLNIDELPIRRAIALPEKMYFNPQTLGIQTTQVNLLVNIILIDPRDLPRNYEITKEFKVLYKKKEWDIVDIKDHADSIIELSIKEVEGSTV